MSFSRQDKLNEQSELLGRLCNEDLDAEGRGQVERVARGRRRRRSSSMCAIWTCRR